MLGHQVSSLLKPFSFSFVMVRHAGRQVGTSRDLVRKPIRVYSPDGKLLAEKEEIPSNILTSSDDNGPASTFSKVMSEITKNKLSKNIILEGGRLIKEGLNAGAKLEYLFLLKTLKTVPEDVASLMDSTTKVHRISHKHLETWTSMTTPPGLIGICRKPTVEALANQQSLQSELTPLVIICDNIREPGNLGSILRSAAAAGCKRALLSKGCADPWDSKVLRGGCGAHFYVPIVQNIPTEFLGNYMSPECVTTKTDSSLDENRRQRTGIFLADSNVNDSRSSLPISSYADINYSEFSDIYLIIGGETEGLTEETLKLSRTLQFPSDSFVSRINIPMYKNFDSLNAAHACSIITFEIVRQIMLKKK